METVSEAQASLDRWIAGWDKFHFGQWAISVKDAPETIVGFGGLAYLLYGTEEKINLGFRFATAVWGRGLATDFARTAIHYGFQTLKHHAIWAKVRENHLASRRVLEKAGLKQIDVLDDVPGAALSIAYRIDRAAP